MRQYILFITRNLLLYTYIIIINVNIDFGAIIITSFISK